jgi:Na+/H+-translocating membrane pyrophosphatase
MAFTYSKLAEVTVGSGGSATITFNNIPQNYNDLILKVSARAITDTQSAPVLLNINGNTSLLTSKRILGTGGSAISQSGSGNSGIGGILGNGSDFTASTFGNGEVYIPNYSGNNPKSISSDSVTENNASGSYASLAAILWNSVTAITTITLTQEVGSMAQHSTATLYGVKAEV